MAILTTVGRKSGRCARCAAISAARRRGGDDGVQGWLPKLPIWYFNVVAADTVDIQIGSVKRLTGCARPTPMRRQCCG
ncbi:MAG: nitroreductase family deazaflavin-dependent oxidoreductase [Haliea sp.]|nr:nitroreductase family deazaflavin-dependent oxidoreductase [Haliea sp.]